MLKRSVRLTAEKTPGNPRQVQLSWNNVNVAQESYSLWITEPIQREIASGEAGVLTEISVVDDDWNTVTYQVQVKDKDEVYKSNRVTISYEKFGNSPELFMEQSGSGVVVKAMDPSEVTENMVFALEFGYRVRRGSTFGSDSEYDLDLMKTYKAELSSGVRIEKASKINSVSLIVERPDFYVHFSGFNNLLDPALKAEFIGASE